jgi:protein-tyrosine phosphatase
LFVCTGNVCRSPIAERLTTALSGQLGITGVTVSSAGVRAVIGREMHPDAAQIVEHYGGDPRDFTARQINPKIAGGADLVLTMTREHRHAVLEMAPRQLRRTFTLKEAAAIVAQCGARQIDELSALRAQVPAGEFFDIADPIGQSPEFFAGVGEQIAGLLPGVVNLCRTA